MIALTDLDPYHHFFISLALGLLVGLQREWADAPLGGIRSFTLTSLLGTLCAFTAEKYGAWFVGAGFIAVSALTVTGRLFVHKTASDPDHKSLVTELSLLLIFVIGVLVRSHNPLVAAALAGLLGAFLHVKLELHSIADRFSKEEIFSIMQFMVLALVILPLIPDRSFGPNGALNLYNIWLMVVLIVGIGLFGYIIYKFAGERTGMLSGGLLGGLISSTATTFSYARLAGENPRNFHAIVILISWVTLYARVFFELRVVAPDFVIWPQLLFLTTASAALVFWLWKKNGNTRQEQGVHFNPADLKTAIFFVFIYTLTVWLFATLKDEVGAGMLSLLSFVAGLFDVDAIALSTGRLVQKEVITAGEGRAYVFIALFANTLFKGGIALMVGGKALFRLMLIPWAGILALIAAVIVWSVWF